MLVVQLMKRLSTADGIDKQGEHLVIISNFMDNVAIYFWGTTFEVAFYCWWYNWWISHLLLK